LFSTSRGRRVAHAPVEKTNVLRITTQINAGDVSLLVEGRLAGPCVCELAKCWERAVAGESPLPTVVDLSDVSFIDSTGKQLLSKMHAHGIKLVANGLMSKFVVDEIERA
jgi:anti-anti-sigma regulatory factor